MDRLIPVVDKIRDAFFQAGLPHELNLPQIAVVGAQSAGKSSVLETIVGRDFLPRGQGIVTRRPLILQIQNNSRSEGPPRAWARFDHCRDREFTDFEEVRKEIEAVTESECGHNKGVLDLPINLTVFAPDVVDLTLIDLPGLTKNPVGDQPPDIEMQIRRMSLRYITPETCIILAVSPANADIANSDALQIAREVDPEGKRTIGVLTKLDLMDQGTDAMDVLNGRCYPLARGYIGLVNRGQKAIDGKVDMKKALADEAEFFAKHPKYSLIKERMGTPYLAKTLNQILLAHIREYVPTLRTKITDLIRQTREILTYLGRDFNDDLSQRQMLLQKLREYSSAVIDVIDGTGDVKSTIELKGGALINFILHEAFVPHLSKIGDDDDFTQREIETEIRNTKGFRNGLFIPEVAFEKLVRNKIVKLEEPAKGCAMHVFEELVKIAELQSDTLNRFPLLKQRVTEFVVSLLRNFHAPLVVYLENMIKIESSYINTHHPDFFGGSATVYEFMEKVPGQAAGAPVTGAAATNPALPPGHPGAVAGAGAAPGAAAVPGSAPGRAAVAGPHTPLERERREAEMIRQIVLAYFSVVRKTVSDQVPKACIWHLVARLKSELLNSLIIEFNKDEMLADLLREDEAVARRRNGAIKMMNALQKAESVLSEVQTIYVPQ